MEQPSVKLAELPSAPILLTQVHWKDYLKAKNYNQDINKMCTICQQGQMDRHGKIVIKCNGLAKAPDSVINEYKDTLNKEELDLIDQMFNPYGWAKANIKSSVFRDRWYQEQMTRCTAVNTIYRCGRRSGKSFGLAVKALHRMFMNGGVRILMLAPAETQVKEFDEILQSLIYGFKEDFSQPGAFLSESRKKPYYEQNYSNGSRFRGLIAANEGKTVRGQAADIIILDEIDYISPDALAAVVAIMLDNPNVELWVASTPAGKKELYKYEETGTYKIWHFPSFVIPHYSDSLDKEMRSKYGDGLNYIHEVLAEYGESEQGVFQSYFIDQCREDSKLLEDKRDTVLKYRDRYIIILGVDWNDDKVGTRLVSVAFDRIDIKFFIVDAETVSREGWTQVDATNKLIEKNRKFNYDKIYLDEGFGVSTIQFIKKYAIDKYGKTKPGDLDYADLQLANVVGINFSSNIELNDYETNQIIKKDMKSYIVETSVRYLERLAYRFDDKYDKDLITQMNNYIIARRTPTGKAVYAAHDPEIGDHDLDAFMLAILGFNLEYMEIAKSINASQIAAILVRGNGEGGYEFTPSLVRATTKEEQGPVTKFNNLFHVISKTKTSTDKNDKFFKKYVMNSEIAMSKGLQRTTPRSQFKKGHR